MIWGNLLFKGFTIYYLRPEIVMVNDKMVNVLVNSKRQNGK